MKIKVFINTMIKTQMYLNMYLYAIEFNPLLLRNGCWQHI